MDYAATLKAIESLPLAVAIAGGDALFPWIECVHVLAIVLLVGVIAMLDLRLIGWASRERPLDKLVSEWLPLVWGAFVAAVISGLLLFIAKASVYGHNLFFAGKMLLLVAAGFNMAYFHRVTWQGVAEWGRTTATTPRAARLAGAASLVLWIVIVAFGRWIGFTR